MLSKVRRHWLPKSNADARAGSLRAAIATANGDKTPHTIVFAPNLTCL